MPLQALQRQVIFFSTTSKVPENIQLLLEMVSKVSFTEKSVSKEREIIQQEIGMYQIVRLSIIFWCFRKFISWNTVSR